MARDRNVRRMNVAREHPRLAHVKLVSLAFGLLKFLLPAIMRCCVFRKYATIKGERWKEGKDAPRISVI